MSRLPRKTTVGHLAKCISGLLLFSFCSCVSISMASDSGESDSVALPEALYQKVYPKEFDRALKLLLAPELDTKAYDQLLARTRELGGAYGYHDCLLFCGGLHALEYSFDNEEKVPLRLYARSLFEEYMKRVSRCSFISSVPEDVMKDRRLAPVRKRSLVTCERLMQRWGQRRWSLGCFKCGTIGEEYEKCLALYCLSCSADELDAFRDSYEQLISSNTGNGGEDLGTECKDTLLFFCAMRLDLLDGNSNNELAATSQPLILNLRQPTWDKQWTPLPFGLLDHVSGSWSTLGPFRTRGVVVLVLFSTITAGLIAYLKRKPYELPDLGEFRIDRTDLLALVNQRYLKYSPAKLFLFSQWILGLGVVSLSWAEGTLKPDGFVVDRGLLDYLSFPFSLFVLVPTFITISLALSQLVAVRLPDALRATYSDQRTLRSDKPLPPPVIRLWHKHAACCNSWICTSVFILLACIILALQHGYQWPRDPGTAFVDLVYPGHVSITSLYFTAISMFIYYIILSWSFRGMVIMKFLATVYGKKWRHTHGLQTQFDPIHEDRCSGLRYVGLILLLFYALLLLLATQLLLNIVEKLRFYESISVVLHNTFVSVAVFGAAFLILVPILIGWPLLSIHFALREQWWKELTSNVLLLNKCIATLREQADKDAIRYDDVEGYVAFCKMREDLRRMRLWPFDIRLAAYFIGSHLAPLAPLLISLLRSRISSILPTATKLFGGN